MILPGTPEYFLFFTWKCFDIRSRLSKRKIKKSQKFLCYRILCHLYWKLELCLSKTHQRWSSRLLRSGYFPLMGKLYQESIKKQIWSKKHIFFFLFSKTFETWKTRSRIQNFIKIKICVSGKVFFEAAPSDQARKTEIKFDLYIYI